MRDPPSPLAIVRWFFGAAVVVAVVAQVVELVRGNGFDWRLVTLALTLWAIWSFAAEIYRLVVEPLGGFFSRALLTGRVITVEDETAFLEDRLSRPDLEPHHEILSGIRLAEIYRMHQDNHPKADALLDRLLAKYPDAPELRGVRRYAPPA